MKIKTLHDIPELKGKRVLLRVDFNVPIKDGKITDSTRIREALPTIKYLQEKGAKIILMTHLGRPDGKVVENLRLNLVKEEFEKLLGKSVKKSNEIFADTSEIKDGEILMLENIRFNIGEEKCDTEFTKKLASLGEIFVNDAFGTAHRRHASTAGLADFLPAYGGFLIEKEMAALSPIVHSEPARPFTMIFGGAKIDTKIGVIKNFIEKADYFLIGGAIANTFLKAAGYNVGKSLVENEKLDLAREIMLECEQKKTTIILPKDSVVADEISETAQTTNISVQDIEGDMNILDIGHLTSKRFCEIIKESQTVIWNGPLGLSEYKPFQNGSRTVANCLATHKCVSIIGGGDTADMIKRFGLAEDKFTHISTGGGACIEFLEGKELPGIAILKK